jgi:hypothetical protein
MHKRVLGCPIFIAVLFLMGGGLFEVYGVEGNEWLRTPYMISLFVILPLAAVICIRLTLAEDDEIQSLNLKDFAERKGRGNRENKNTADH